MNEFEFIQERIGAYHYTITDDLRVCVQDLLKPYNVPESAFEGVLIEEVAFDDLHEAKEWLRARILLDLHAQAAAGLKLLEEPVLKPSVLVITGCDVATVTYVFRGETKETTLEKMFNLAEDAANLEMDDEGQLLAVIYERYRECSDPITGMSASTDELVM